MERERGIANEKRGRKTAKTRANGGLNESTDKVVVNEIQGGKNCNGEKTKNGERYHWAKKAKLADIWNECHLKMHLLD